MNKSPVNLEHEEMRRDSLEVLHDTLGMNDEDLLRVYRDIRSKGWELVPTELAIKIINNEGANGYNGR